MDSQSVSVESSPAVGETVIVVMDGNREKGSVDALEWAIRYIVGRNDTVVVLGVLPEIGKKSNPSCLPFHVGIGSSGIYVKLEFSNSEMTSSELQKEIERKKRQYQKLLEPYYHHCKKREVKLDIRLAAGLESKNLAIEEAQKLDPRWIVLDGYFKKDKEYIHKHVDCHVALLKSKGVATLIPSKITGPESEEWQIVCRKIDDHTLNSVNLVEEQPHSPKHAPTSPCSCSRPLPWRFGLQRAFGLGEIEEMTNGFNSVILRDDHRIIYGGVFEESHVIVICFPADDQAFCLLKIVSRVRHRNILTLIGYCCVGDSVFFICDCPQRSLEACLLCDKEATNLSWETRWAIALEIGAAIEYLHEEFTDGPVVNLSLCSSHIAIDAATSFAMLCIYERTVKQTKLDDDGDGNPMNKFLPLRGMNLEINELVTADIKEYGVLLLELLSGQSRRLFEKDGQGLVDWALPLIEKKLFSLLLDPRLIEPSDPLVVHMARAALACLKNDSNHCVKISKVLAIVRGDE